MAAKFEFISISNKNDTKNLLKELQPHNDSVNVTLQVRKYAAKNFSFENDVKDKKKVNAEFKRRGVNSISVEHHFEESLELLEYFEAIKPRIFVFMLTSKADLLGKAGCGKLFEKLDKIKPKNVTFFLQLKNISEDFMAKFSQEVQDMSCNFNQVVFYSDKEKLKGLDSLDVLNKLSKFKQLLFSMTTQKFPQKFRLGLTYIKTDQITLSIGAIHTNLAFEMAFKNTSNSIKIRFDNVDKLKPLLPLFAVSSKTIIVEVTRPKQMVNRTELKAILKYRQRFKYAAVVKNKTVPFNRIELKYLFKHKIFSTIGLK